MTRLAIPTEVELPLKLISWIAVVIAIQAAFPLLHEHRGVTCGGGKPAGPELMNENFPLDLLEGAIVHPTAADM